MPHPRPLPKGGRGVITLKGAEFTTNSLTPDPSREREPHPRPLSKERGVITIKGEIYPLKDYSLPSLLERGWG